MAASEVRFGAIPKVGNDSHEVSIVKRRSKDSIEVVLELSEFAFLDFEVRSMRVAIRHETSSTDAKSQISL